MSKKQPQNNRISKEAMFKKIMPSAAPRPHPERPSPSADGGDELLDGLADDLINRSVSSFEDDLLEQLPPQPRVFATPAAPTAPVPPPPTVSVPSFEGYAIGGERRFQEPDGTPQQPEPVPAAEAPAPPQTPQEFPPPVPPQAVPPQFPPPQPQEQPQYPGYVPTQPYPPQYAYPYPPYPPYPPPYPYPAPEQAAPEPAPKAPAGDGAPIIEQAANATVVADSASVVTDTVVIQENYSSASAPPPAREPFRAPPTEPELEEPPEPEHTFQAEMNPEAVSHLLDDYDAFPPLSEGDGVVTNVMERITGVWLDDVIARIRGCSCEKCRMDVAALALNRLPPRYVLTDELTEELFCSRRTVAETVRALYLAAFQVKAFPRH